MTPQLLGRLLKIEKKFNELESHPSKPLINYSQEKSAISVKFLKKVFLIFYEIGIFGEIDDAKNPPDNISAKVITTRTKILDFISKHVNWFAHYISVYARKEIDFVDLSSKEVVYRIRSGIEFFITDFLEITPEFDQTLAELKEFSSVDDEFDSILTHWIESGLHYPLKEVDIPKNLPKTHWWWFKAVFN